MNVVLQRRLRQLRSRRLVRAWEYRQRRHAHGAWLRLRRVFTDASEAYAVSADQMSTLLAEGYRREPAGDAFEPPKTIVFVTLDRLARIPDARPVPIRLGGELLLAEQIVLVPFEGAERQVPVSDAP